MPAQLRERRIDTRIGVGEGSVEGGPKLADKCVEVELPKPKPDALGRERGRLAARYIVPVRRCVEMPEGLVEVEEHGLDSHAAILLGPRRYLSPFLHSRRTTLNARRLASAPTYLPRRRRITPSPIFSRLEKRNEGSPRPVLPKLPVAAEAHGFCFT